MNQDQPSSINKESQTECRLCGQFKEQMYGAVCAECAKETLLKYLPHLKRTLEDKYGSMLDQWLASGRFLEAHWKAEIDLNLSHDRLRTFVREVVRDAVSKGEIQLSLPGGESWKPIQTNQLLDSIYEQCEEEYRRLIASLLKAINNAPTKEGERELIEVVSGKKRVSKRYVREEAISAAVLNHSTPLPLPARALIELRYRADGGRSEYAAVEDGEISSVWKEIEEALPVEIVKLIVNDNSFMGK
ncbi:MAG TPA: hypothetical protein VF791_10795 [Pyrinomonadaceae bacterium]